MTNTSNWRVSLLALWLLASCSTLDGSRPDTWIESTTPDLYFVGTPPEGAATASVVFSTAPLERGRLPLDFTIQLAAFSDVGDNYYNDTLEYVAIDPVYEGDEWWTWSGTIVLQPMFDTPLVGRRTVGVHIRGLPYEAVRTQPLVHRFCQIDLLGAGVIDCDPWLNALISTKFICRGLVGQLIACHGIGFEIVPLIRIVGIARNQGALMPGAGEFTYLIINGVTFTHHADGWRYTAPGGTEQGPFATPDEAAKDAVERSPWPGPVGAIDSAAAAVFPEEGLLRLHHALERETASRSSEWPPPVTE
jgi:hypothetical protein